MKRRTYTGADVLRLVKQHAARELMVSEFRLQLSAEPIPTVTVTVMEEGKTLGAFVLFGPSRLMCIDRIEGDDVVLEDPFHQRAEYPLRMSVAEALELEAAAASYVESEFLRVKQPLAPMAKERSGLDVATVLAALRAGIPFLAKQPRRRKER